MRIETILGVKPCWWLRLACVCWSVASVGHLFSPDKVDRDDERGDCVLRFNSKYGIEAVATVLGLSVKELLGDCDRLAE